MLPPLDATHEATGYIDETDQAMDNNIDQLGPLIYPRRVLELDKE